MLHLVDSFHQLHLRILDQQLLREGLMQRNVNVLVDGRRNDEAGMLAVIRRQVGASPPQGNPQRRARDDHVAFSRYTRSTMRNAACAAAMPGRGWRLSRMSSRNSANSVSHELSAMGNSHAVVSGGPISGVIL